MVTSQSLKRNFCYEFFMKYQNSTNESKQLNFTKNSNFD